MELAAELEDDLFFADLSKQISLLIMDDDEDPHPLANYPSVALQAISHAIQPPIIQGQFVYEQSCKRESKGTGVFIPQSTQPRRKQSQRQSRFGNNSSYYAKSQHLRHHHHHHQQQQQQQQFHQQQQVHDTTKMVVVSHQVTSNNAYTYGSFKPKYGRA